MNPGGIYSPSIALPSKGKAGMDSMDAEGEETRGYLEGNHKGEFYTVISEHWLLLACSWIQEALGPNINREKTMEGPEEILSGK